jgi:hypothetical protein
MLGTVLDRTQVTEGTVRPPLVVPLDPVPNGPARLLKRLEGVLPDTLFFETPKESFNDAVLFRGVGRDELLLQPVIPTGLPEPPTLEDQTVVAAEDGAPIGRSVQNRWRQAASTARSASFARLRSANS